MRSRAALHGNAERAHLPPEGALPFDALEEVVEELIHGDALGQRHVHAVARHHVPLLHEPGLDRRGEGDPRHVLDLVAVVVHRVPLPPPLLAAVHLALGLGVRGGLVVLLQGTARKPIIVLLVEALFGCVAHGQRCKACAGQLVNVADARTKPPDRATHHVVYEIPPPALILLEINP